MPEPVDITKRLADRQGKAAYNKRLDAMEVAWRKWRNEVIEAMAARVKAAGTAHDEELELLVMEMDHVAMVRHALRCELGIDPDMDQEASSD
jgi:hypothetical protein